MGVVNDCFVYYLDVCMTTVLVERAL